MPQSGSADKLADRRHVTVVLRLLLDRHGRLIYGEVVDPAAHPQRRFVGWRGVTRAIRAWLSAQELPDATT